MNFLKFTQDQNLGGCGFPGSWYPSAWETVIKAADALPLNEAELAFFRQHTGRQEPPQSPARELYFICGRRSGKSRITAAWGVHAAACADTSVLGPGETGYVVIIAPTQKQANLILNYCRAIFRLSPILAPMVVADVDGEIRLSNGTAITVLTCSSASVRGFTLLCAIFEETSSWRVDGRDPGIETKRAVLPGLSGRRLISIGSPRGRQGIDYEAHKRHFGKDGSNILIWVAESRAMNPTLPLEVVEQALAEDYESAKAEYLAQFRDDIAGFLDSDTIDSLVIPGRRELAPQEGIRYFAFSDPSGGRQDSFTLGIAHAGPQGRVILDTLRRRVPPFNPGEVVAEFAQVLKEYRCFEVVGDRYSAEWCVASFRERGITYRNSERDRSQIYIEAMPLFTRAEAEILDDKVLLSELRGLERKVRPLGKDMITHGPGGKDDAANSACGAMVLAKGGVKKIVRSLLRSYRDPGRPEPKPEPAPLHPRLQYAKTQEIPCGKGGNEK